jgi:hypothetical protein
VGGKVSTQTNSLSAERVALETGVGELKLNVADGEEDLKELEAKDLRVPSTIALVLIGVWIRHPGLTEIPRIVPQSVLRTIMC